MKWKKLGLLFSGEPHSDWYFSHAALPTPVLLYDDLYRVFFSGRDKQNRARIGYFDFLLDQHPKVLQTSRAPVLDLGRLGAFDDNGVTSSWITPFNATYYCYYTGWSLGITVPFYFYIGLATGGTSSGNFRRVSQAPVVGRSAFDPFLTASPCVLVENGLWRMWYISAQRWEATSKGPRHHYSIKYAESTDGIHWMPSKTACFDYESQSEYAFARPCVLHENSMYRMWYSVRGERYRIGYAESEDGLAWRRKDCEVGIEPSKDGWDSEMIEYPYVFRHRNNLYMLYNGNGYGKSGIGLAVEEQP